MFRQVVSDQVRDAALEVRLQIIVLVSSISVSLVSGFTHSHTRVA